VSRGLVIGSRQLVVVLEEEAREREKTAGSTMTLEQAIALAESLSGHRHEQSPRSLDDTGRAEKTPLPGPSSRLRPATTAR
jgi:hypothetical protein